MRDLENGLRRGAEVKVDSSSKLGRSQDEAQAESAAALKEEPQNLLPSFLPFSFCSSFFTSRATGPMN